MGGTTKGEGQNDSSCRLRFIDMVLSVLFAVEKSTVENCSTSNHKYILRHSVCVKTTSYGKNSKYRLMICKLNVVCSRLYMNGCAMSVFATNVYVHVVCLFLFLQSYCSVILLASVCCSFLQKLPGSKKAKKKKHGPAKTVSTEHTFS